MRYLLVILLTMLVIGCNQSHEQNILSEEEFTDAYIVKLNAKEATLSIERKGSLELEVRDSSDNRLKIYLGNAYKEYQQAPESRDNILDDFARAMLETIHTSESKHQIDVKRIVPVIKDAEYLAEIKQSLGKAADNPSKFDIYYETLNNDLLVFYAVDNEQSLKYLGREELNSVRMNTTDLRQQSLTNLKATLPEIKKHGESGTYMVTAGGVYEASLLLMDSLWTKDTFKVHGDIVVSIPSRDLLLVTGSKDNQGLARVRKVAQEAMDEGSYTITDQLFVRKEGKWVRF